MYVFLCVCIILVELFFLYKLGLMINLIYVWLFLKYLMWYMCFCLKGNLSVILMIKMWKGEGYKDLGGSLLLWCSID